MYIPKPFREEDPNQLVQIIEENSFEILITANPTPQAALFTQARSQGIGISTGSHGPS